MEKKEQKFNILKKNAKKFSTADKSNIVEPTEDKANKKDNMVIYCPLLKGSKKESSGFDYQPIEEYFKENEKNYPNGIQIKNKIISSLNRLGQKEEFEKKDGVKKMKKQKFQLVWFQQKFLRSLFLMNLISFAIIFAASYFLSNTKFSPYLLFFHLAIFILNMIYLYKVRRNRKFLKKELVSLSLNRDEEYSIKFSSKFNWHSLLDQVKIKIEIYQENHPAQRNSDQINKISIALDQDTSDYPNRALATNNQPQHKLQLNTFEIYSRFINTKITEFFNQNQGSYSFRFTLP